MKIQQRSLLSAVIAVSTAIATIGGCRRDASSSKERIDQSILALTADASPTSPPPPTTFDLVFPVGYGMMRATIAASQSVSLGPRDSVLAIDGSPGTVTNAGSGSVKLLPGSSAGSIVSTGSIVLQPNVTVTSAVSAGTVTTHPGDSVGSITQNATLTPLARRSVTVPPLSGTPSNFVVTSGSSTLVPGLYGQVYIQQTAAVTLSAGNYVISDFSLDSSAQINLDTSQGTVNIFVTGSAAWNGRVSGDGTQFVFSYLGKSALSFSGPFTGTALVPNAEIKLGPLPSSYSANFYGQQVSVAPGVTVHQIATPLLAASVAVSQTTLCPGQQTEVTLDASGAGAGATTRINGMPGSHQILQFDGAPGPRLIVASVLTPDGRADFTTIPITVQSCTPAPGAPPPIVLHFWATPDQQNVVELMVHDLDSTGLQVPPTGPATYAWTFGDGSTATTASPLVSHDYTASVDPLSTYNYFTASVTVTTSGGSVSAQKVVPIFSVYAANRAKGVVQPPSTVAASGDNLTFTAKNYEQTPLSITAARVDLLPCDPSLDPIPQSVVPLSVSVPPATTSTVTIPQPPGFSPAICAVGAHLMGNASTGTVYTDSYVRMKENPLTKQAVTDPNTIAILNQASAHTVDPNQFDHRELRQLQAQGLITQLPAAVPPGATYQSPGEECSPGDTAPGLVCQPTLDWVVNPGELLNAFKGDFVIHHSCGDLVADMLHSLGQSYTHSMTMTKNRTEVRHSTASKDRIIGSVNYASATLDSQKLQFGFPGTEGTTPFTIDQMIHGYCVADPDNSGGSSQCPSGSWFLDGMLHPDAMQCSTDTEVVYPLVIRPAPDATPAQLQAVTPVGDQALSLTAHYRFFMYSRADEHAVATSGPSWAVGTDESVCSLFNLESTSSAGPGGTPLLLNGGGPNDGMRTYSIGERTIAANELFGELYNLVEGQIPIGWQAAILAFCSSAAGLVVCGGGELALQGYLDLLANNIGNQVVNCFANDGCGDTSGTWRNVTSGIAVGPDDIRKWAGPPNAYGYPEPLVYAPTSYRHKYAWAPAGGDASMTVKVVDGSGNPFPNATVILNSIPYGTTDSTGTLQVPSLDQGTYDVEAQWFPQSTPPPPNPPTPPDLRPSEIFALPFCNTAPQTGIISPCSVTGVNPTCPDTWASECVIGTTAGPSGETCACAAPPSLLRTCDLAIADRPASVPSSGNVTVELTLCTNCQNGVPAACLQYCASTADCDNNQVCSSSGLCVAPPRIVNIQTTSDSTFLAEDDNVPCHRGTYPIGFQMMCDPNSTPTGGTAVQTVCVIQDQCGPLPPGSVCGGAFTADQAVFTVTCQEDQQSGGISLSYSVSLSELSGDCTSSGTFQASGSQTGAIAPASAADPTPTAELAVPDVCYDSPLEVVCNGFDTNPCHANDVHVNLVFTSEPAP